MADAPKIKGTDTLRQAYPKLNSAIDNSNEAITKAVGADGKANNAVTTANEAKTKAESVQSQFDQVVIEGDSSVEAAQARVNEVGETFTTLQSRLNTSDYQRKNTMNNIRGSFARRLSAGDVTEIKLIGDSITVGVGATNGGASSSGRVILTMSDGTVIREAREDSPSWANFMREYLATNYPGIKLINNGIGGWSVKEEGTKYRNTWVGADNDVVFVMLGTNDRRDCSSELEFEQYIEPFLEYVASTCKTMVVMTASPTLNDYLPDGTPATAYILKMENIDKVITKVCMKNGWEHISHYRGILKYMSETQTPPEVLLQSDGWYDGQFPSSHPIDAGYRLMWKLMQQELGLITNTVDWQNKQIDNTRLRTAVLSGNTVKTTDPISKFKVNHITHHLVISANVDLPNFPEKTVGTLITQRYYNDLWSFQTYTLYTNGKTYKRTWNTSTSSWTEWTQMGTMAEKPHAEVSSTTPITSFSLDGFTYTLFPNANPDISNFPESTAGTLITFRPRSANYGYQEYHVYQTNKVYKRYWTGSSWAAWAKISAV